MTIHLPKSASTILGLLLLVGAAGAWAQAPAQPAPPPGTPLSIQECLRITLENNPTAAAVLHTGRSAQAKVGLTESAYYPTLDLSGNLSRSYSEPEGTSGRKGLVLGSSTSTSDAALLSGQYTIWDSGQRKASMEGAKAGFQAAEANVTLTLQNLAQSVETAFYNVQGATWALEVSKDTLRQADLNDEAAKARNDVGLAARSDVLKAATTQANAKLGVIQAEALLASTKATLASLMGLPSDTPLELVPAHREFTPPQLPDWASNWVKAQAALPEIKAAFETSESFRFSYNGAKAAYLPTVTASGTAGLFDAGNWPNRQEWSAGITLRVPVFTGFARKYQALQAKEAWESSKSDLQATVLAAEKAAYAARIALDEAIQAVPAAEAYVASAQESMDVVNGQYQNGLASQLDVIDALAALSSARLSLISARLSVATAYVAWQRATGIDLLEGVPLPSIAQNRPDGDKKP